MADTIFPMDLLAAIQNELDATINDMLNNPVHYGLPETLNRDGADERLEDQDVMWIQRSIARRWSQ